MEQARDNLQRIFYPAFDGGLNLSVPPESLQKNELREAVNVELSPVTGAMTSRGGLFLLAGMGMTAESVAELPGLSGFLASSGGIAKIFTWNRVKEVSGRMSGKGELSAAEWDGGYLVASGGKLQRLTGRKNPRLETIAGSPEYSRQVFVRSGRAGVVTEDNEIRFSCVGDCESWENDPEDDSTGQYVEIGYKDGMNVDAVMPLSRDLIVFKSPENEPDKGIIYRLTGDYPDWSVLEVAHNIGTFSPRSVQSVGNDIYFAGVSGVASLSAVTNYGEIQAKWPDRKVNAALSRLMSQDAELWNIPVKSQLWVKPQKLSREVWVYDYSAGIWTTYEFPAEVQYADGSKDAVYVFMGNNVYRLADWKAEDDVGKLTCGITARMKMGTLMTGNQVLIRRGMVSFRIQSGCESELRLGGFRMRFSHDVTEKSAFEDMDCAYDDESEIIPSEKVITSRRMCLVRGWTVTPEVEMTGGGCALSTMGIEMGEV